MHSSTSMMCEKNCLLDTSIFQGQQSLLEVESTKWQHTKLDKCNMPCFNGNQILCVVKLMLGVFTKGNHISKTKTGWAWVSKFLFGETGSNPSRPNGSDWFVALKKYNVCTYQIISINLHISIRIHLRTIDLHSHIEPQVTNMYLGTFTHQVMWLAATNRNSHPCGSMKSQEIQHRWLIRSWTNGPPCWFQPLESPPEPWFPMK